MTTRPGRPGDAHRWQVGPTETLTNEVWSGGGQGGGYVTGDISLYLPGLATINLVAGTPVNGGPPSPARVATLSGTVTADLAFTGTLTDPSQADTSFQPVFSTSACTYQVTGHHG